MESDGTHELPGAAERAVRAPRPGLVYFAFDLMYLDGIRSARAFRWSQRKRCCETLVAGGTAHVDVRQHVEAGKAQRFFAQACKLGLEGIDRQARRRALPSGRAHELAQDQVQPAPGDRHRRLHRRRRASRKRFRRAAPRRATSDGTLRYAGQGGHRFRRRDAAKPASRSSYKLRARHAAPSRTRRAATRRRRALGSARPRRRDRVHRMDAATARCAIRRSRACAQDKKAKRRRARASRRSDAAVSEPAPARRSRRDRARRGRRLGEHASAGRRRHQLSNPDKVLYPEAEHHQARPRAVLREIADWILPHVSAIGR